MTLLPQPKSDAEPRLCLGQTKLVILDFDGVIADSEVLSLTTLRRALAEHGLALSLAEVRARFLGRSLRSICDALRAHDATVDTAAFAAAWENRLFEAFRADLSPVPGLLAFLDGLSATGLPYCVASSSRFDRLGVALEAMGLAGRFPRIFSAQQVAKGKPAPDLFLFAAAKMEVAAEACLVIEDSPHGIQAAQAAGMRSVGFVGGRHLTGLEVEHGALLSDLGAEAVLSRFDQISLGNPQNRARPT